MDWKSLDLIADAYCVVGFTGTQAGMTEAQQVSVRRLLRLFNWTELHHGDCIGADAQAHDIATNIGIDIVIHPPVDDAKRAWKSSERMRPPQPYLDRNRAIVAASHFMIATPGEAQEKLRSGTWSTVRYARKANKWTWIILPDGNHSPLL